MSLGIPGHAEALGWLQQEAVPEAADWLAFAGGAPLLARDYAQSERGERIAQVIALLKQGGRNALLNWPATDREHIEVLAEVLQKWALDQAFAAHSATRKYFTQTSGKPPVGDKADAWLRFAREAGPYRQASRHPLNPRLFASDLISRMPD